MSDTAIATHRDRASCDRDDVRRALRHVASTVHVIATRSDSHFFATTATAVVSVCLDPPTLAVCLNKSNALAKHTRPGSPISVSALARHQQDIAAACAGGLPHDERQRFFAESEDADQIGVLGADAGFAGYCVDVIDIGTHALLLVHIERVACREAIEPLVYLDAKYGGFEARI